MADPAGVLGRLVPEGVQDAARAELARLTAVLLAVGGICLVFVGIGLWAGSAAMTVAYLVGVVLNGAVLVASRRARNITDVDRLSHGVLGANIILVAVLTPVTGGPETWNVYYLSVFPLYAFLQLGLRSGVVWSLATLGLVFLIPSLPAVVDFEPGLELRAVQPALAVLFVAGIAAIGRRVLDWRMAEVENARSEAVELLAVRARFVGDTAVTLRVPLSDMLERTSRLAARLEDDGVRHRVETIERCGQDLEALLDDLSDALALRGGTLSLHRRPSDPRALAEQVVALFAARAQGRGLELRVEGLADDVVVDPRRIRQVLSNLVGNSLKFTTEGEVVLTVSADDDRTRFQVRDTGPGLAEPERLLEAFEQGPGAREQGGTGLGLWISKALLEQMGGGLEITSVEGRGTTVTAWVPS